MLILNVMIGSCVFFSDSAQDMGLPFLRGIQDPVPCGFDSDSSPSEPHLTGTESPRNLRTLQTDHSWGVRRGLPCIHAGKFCECYLFTKYTSVCVHLVYLIHEFHNLIWITEINEHFHDILIYWDAPVNIQTSYNDLFVLKIVRLSSPFRKSLWSPEVSLQQQLLNSGRCVEIALLLSKTFIYTKLWTYSSACEMRI